MQCRTLTTCSIVMLAMSVAGMTLAQTQAPAQGQPTSAAQPSAAQAPTPAQPPLFATTKVEGTDISSATKIIRQSSSSRPQA